MGSRSKGNRGREAVYLFAYFQQCCEHGQSWHPALFPRLRRGRGCATLGRRVCWAYSEHLHVRPRILQTTESQAVLREAAPLCARAGRGSCRTLPCSHVRRVRPCCLSHALQALGFEIPLLSWAARRTDGKLDAKIHDGTACAVAVTAHFRCSVIDINVRRASTKK